MGKGQDHQRGNQAARWRRQQRALAAPRVAIPVYTPKDYPLIRELPGTDDMPATWKEWAVLFEASKKKLMNVRPYVYDNVRIRPDLLKAWLDANSLSASERSRQLYAQGLLDARKAQRKALEQERLAREASGRIAANTPPPPDPPDYPLWVDKVVDFMRSLISFRRQPPSSRH
ncbi:hypothetical protein [Mesorhizobium huakuii]|uniref:Uncharacterized protein n=1 Tax=Mesorhizobium huakuii TaxID=28104 RepID=A0A7G6T2K4_9HYPH|nr:hypothetical protein [Mesorhizobium huakuii]QND60986.1 hypothetical protein HB778_34305 [Mesorhizobium huakuii]